MSAEFLQGVLDQLKLKCKVCCCRREGAFLICDMALKPGGTVSRIERHGMEMALAMMALDEPLIYPVPSKGIVRMELMMEEQGDVPFGEVSSSPEFLGSGQMLPLALGKTRRGNIMVADLAAMPHLLVAGTTGSGKSVMLHSSICSLLMRRQRRKVFVALIDPKRVEFSHYEGIPQLWAPIAHDAEEALGLLSGLAGEMDRRFGILQRSKCRDITCYRGRMPYIVLVMDELADLMMTAKKQVQDLVCRLAQKSRACGIHLIAATQRPSADIVTGIIKANFPSRLSCQVSSATDSRVVLDRNGAEKLAGNGDAILDAPGYPFVRLKGAYLSESDIASVVRRHAGRPWWSRIWIGS